MKRLICALCLLLAALCPPFFGGCAGKNAAPAGLDAARAKLRYVIHAAGALEGPDAWGNPRGYRGSNSLEGLEQCAAAGAEAIELDFNFTSDRSLVCVHDWYKEYAEEIENGVPLTRGEFLSLKIYGCFTPISLEDVAAFLRAHPGIVVVTDIKDDNLAGLAAIADTCPDLLDRFVAQIYDESEYEPARALGFDYIVFTLYRLGWNEKTDWRALGEFARAHPLAAFTFSYELCAVDGFVAGMKKSGVPLLIHTVNEGAETYFAEGIDGVYTDYLP